MAEGIEVRIEERFREGVDRVRFRKLARQVLKHEAVARPYEVGLVFTDAETVRQLNRQYRGVDEPTDVLAFYMLTGKEADDSFALPPDGISRLGDVVISYPQAVAQAAEQGHSTERELALLVIHGILHLLGYDHEKTDDENRMRAREKELLDMYSPS
jgi:probable rRNA maturation factor